MWYYLSCCAIMRICSIPAVTNSQTHFGPTCYQSMLPHSPFHYFSIIWCPISFSNFILPALIVSIEYFKLGLDRVRCDYMQLHVFQLFNHWTVYILNRSIFIRLLKYMWLHAHVFWLHTILEITFFIQPSKHKETSKTLMNHLH